MPNQDEKNLIAGVDEAGRGPLAGDVFAAAVILPKNYVLPNLKDSKKLSAKQRQQLAIAIKKVAVAYAVSKATVTEIETMNILQASLLAMSRAIDALSPNPTLVQIDGNQIPKQLKMTAECIIKGDTKIPAISAASILAKVARDDEMLQIDQRYPQYGFAQHKGYGTKQHLIAINEHGILPIHRKTFKPIKDLL